MLTPSLSAWMSELGDGAQVGEIDPLRHVAQRDAARNADLDLAGHADEFLVERVKPAAFAVALERAHKVHAGLDRERQQVEHEGQRALDRRMAHLKRRRSQTRGK